MIAIPADPQEALARLGALALLLTATEWERGAIIWAMTKPGRSGRQTNPAKFGRMSFSRFADLGIHGLTSHSSVSGVWHAYQAAIDAGVAVAVELGQEVELPETPWSDFYPQDKPTIDDAVTEAILTNPRAVANQAWAELKERRENEAALNEAQRLAQREATIATLMNDEGWTRDEAEERVEDRQPLWIYEAHRRAKQAEIHTASRLAIRIEEIVGIVIAAVKNGDYTLLDDRAHQELRETSELLAQVSVAIMGVLVAEFVSWVGSPNAEAGE